MRLPNVFFVPLHFGSRHRGVWGRLDLSSTLGDEVGFRMCFSIEEETHGVHVGWRICGILSGDRDVRRVDGRGRDVLAAHRHREKEFSLSAFNGPPLL